MPRRRAAPRLWLDKKRGQYVIRDGGRFIRCSTASLGEAEQRLAEYIGSKHKPERGPDPLISDVLLVYWQEHLSQTASAADGRYRIGLLGGWWGTRIVSQITPTNCLAYGGSRESSSGARKDLECLRAAIHYWHRHYGPLAVLPAVILPAKEQPRERWLTRSELARLLLAAKRTEHLKRFILLAYYTGSRSKNILGLKWADIDLSAGIMRRSASGGNAKKRAPPVRLGPRILLHLRRWRMHAHSSRVIYLDGRPISRINKSGGSFKRAVRMAGLGRVSPHTLRHTAATHLMQAGVDIWEAAGFLGMSVPVLVSRYGHHHPDHQKNAAEALARHG